MKNVCAIVLAAGKGTRMQSSKPKVLSTINHQPILALTLKIFKKLNLEKILIVIGYKSDLVKKTLGDSWNFVQQKDLLGTGHAVLVALPALPTNCQTVVVINGDDSCFYKASTLTKIIYNHLKSAAKMTIMATVSKNAAISGRVVRDSSGKMIGIKTGQDGNEVVCGIYLFNRKWLETRLPKVKKALSGEILLTSLISVALEEGSLNEVKLTDPNQWRSINTKKELLAARRLWQKLHI
ncbi:MAG: NTP transferase domain-containing protein [Candidatus Daviesbacteria bacterium]|nr:MAG: NTP transferase domain-containing protein [Candidatus Daviesbacteria bacterium]